METKAKRVIDISVTDKLTDYMRYLNIGYLYYRYFPPDYKRPITDKSIRLISEHVGVLEIRVEYRKHWLDSFMYYYSRR